MLKVLLPLYLLLMCVPTFAVESSITAQMIAASLKERPMADELRTLSEFADAKAADCNTWNKKAFEVQSDLKESCQFPALFNQYKSKINSLKAPEVSGVVLPILSIAEAEIPMLQSGVWQRFIFSESDGFESALELITLRMAIEKSLVAHADFIRRQGPQNIFKPFAAMVVPRMIAVFSGYSQTLRQLVFLNNFKCGFARTQACVVSQKELEKIRAQILSGVGPENFLAGLENMSSENTGMDDLKAKKIQKIVRLIAEVKSQLTLQDLMEKSQPKYLELKNELLTMSSSSLSLPSEETANMLVAVSILSEIYEVQKFKSEIGDRSGEVPPSALSERTLEEINTLKSLVYKALVVKESL